MLFSTSCHSIQLFLLLPDLRFSWRCTFRRSSSGLWQRVILTANTNISEGTCYLSPVTQILWNQKGKFLPSNTLCSHRVLSARKLSWSFLATYLHSISYHMHRLHTFTLEMEAVLSCKSWYLLKVQGFTTLKTNT